MGSNFSAGQRQLLSLSTAILKDSNIFLLDEATANLDKETDRLVQEIMRKCWAGKTQVVVAHRLDTIADSDLIVVLSDGKVVETGHPHALLEKEDGIFAAMSRPEESSEGAK